MGKSTDENDAETVTGLYTYLLSAMLDDTTTPVVENHQAQGCLQSYVPEIADRLCMGLQHLQGSWVFAK
jgi:hypothetical protein